MEVVKMQDHNRGTSGRKQLCHIVPEERRCEVHRAGDSDGYARQEMGARKVNDDHVGQSMESK